MRSSPRRLPALLPGTALITAGLGVGTVAGAAGAATGRGDAGQAAHTGPTVTVSVVPSGDDPDGDDRIPA
ncbi:hypothetical protein MTQ10_04215 [Streptomyces sp. XM83C]|uniref:Uncharacterized protein n=1 Tax=Streptomyces thermocoprophilus TaxID=78356 RepID=A0ABV5VLQ9_9ACTN|nr:hypothetical protein [Streptomyces sp. XM83C]MCK1818830.1 hypothetical protein [Streptomyces sp. XM83C]